MTTQPVSVDLNVGGVDTAPDAAETATVASPESIDDLMGVLTGLIGSASSPEIRQAQVLLLQRLALEGDVIPSRIPAPANITQIGGYLNLLTALGQDDMRTQMLGATLGLAGSLPLPGLDQQPPPLSLAVVSNDVPPGSTGVAATVTMRSDLVSGLATALQTVHTAGGLLPLSAPAALPPVGSAAFDPLLHLGRAVLAAPVVTLVDPQTDAVVLGRAASDTGTSYRLAVRVRSGTTGASTEDWTCLMWDAVSASYAEQTVSGATLLPIETALSGSGLMAVRPSGVPSGRNDLAWARLADVAGLLPGVTRLGDELALVYSKRQIAASAFAPMVDFVWDGGAFATPA
ncbi:MAG TPA: hypothetical protein VGK78_02590 [Nocardioides sp.]|uniref:hypothetical protein n=1 Tax=Nocardioides sp. TaxID=35761 RepID=UPI002F419AE6